MLSFAFRNLVRRPRLFPILSIAVVVAAALLVNFFLRDLERRLIQSEIDFRFGHVKIYPQDYDPAGFSLSNLILSPEAVVHEVQKRLIGAAPRVRFQAMLSSASGDLPILVYAIDSERDDLVFKLREKVAVGRYLAGSEEAVLLGGELAAALGLSIGDELSFLAQGRNGVFHQFSFWVKGLLKTGDRELDASAVFVPLSVAQSGLGLNRGVTEISIRLKNPREALSVSLPSVQAIPWQKMNGQFNWLSAGRRAILTALAVIWLLVVLVGAVNYIHLARILRAEEFAYWRQLGLKRRDFVRLIAWEIGLTILAGILLGLLIGGIVKCFGWL
ncbi:MAG: ABC transporter permease [Candidatus Margulisiibacteriota bacterium]|jgi:lipoprotein-releasing system permease protein